MPRPCAGKSHPSPTPHRSSSSSFVTALALIALLLIAQCPAASVAQETSIDETSTVMSITSSATPSPSASFSTYPTSEARGGTGGDTKILSELTCEDKIVLARLFASTATEFSYDGLSLCDTIRRAAGKLNTNATILVNRAKVFLANLNQTSNDALSNIQQAKSTLAEASTLTLLQRLLQDVTADNSYYEGNVTAAFQAGALTQLRGQWALFLDTLPGINGLYLIDKWTHFQGDFNAFRVASLDNYVNASESFNQTILSMYALQKSVHAAYLGVATRGQRALAARYVRFQSVWSAAIAYSLQYVVAGRAAFENANVTNRAQVSADFKVEQTKVYDMFLTFAQQARAPVIVNSLYTDLYTTLDAFAIGSSGSNHASPTLAPKPLLVWLLPTMASLLAMAWSSLRLRQ